MAIGILGKKIGMTQVFDEEGFVTPVTVIKSEPNQILDLRTEEKNGYTAVQLGYGEKKKNRLTKPLEGHYKKLAELSGKEVSVKQHVKEFRLNDTAEYVPGEYLKVDIFETGELVDVIGTSKGRGFQGVMKRHNFGGGPGGHGSQFHRAPGAVGQCAWPSRIFKGKKMPGRMGVDAVTVKNLKIVAVDLDQNIILVKGAVPGAKSGIVTIKKKQ